MAFYTSSLRISQYPFSIRLPSSPRHTHTVPFGLLPTKVVPVALHGSLHQTFPFLPAKVHQPQPQLTREASSSSTHQLPEDEKPKVSLTHKVVKDHLPEEERLFLEKVEASFTGAERVAMAWSSKDHAWCVKFDVPVERLLAYTIVREDRITAIVSDPESMSWTWIHTAAYMKNLTATEEWAGRETLPQESSDEVHDERSVTIGFKDITNQIHLIEGGKEMVLCWQTEKEGGGAAVPEKNLVPMTRMEEDNSWNVKLDVSIGNLLYYGFFLKDPKTGIVYSTPSHRRPARVLPFLKAVSFVEEWVQGDQPRHAWARGDRLSLLLRVPGAVKGEDQ